MRIAMLLASLALTTSPVEAAEIRFGSLSLDWPAGYTVKSTQPPFELAGPQGAKVLVTVLRPGPSATGSAEGLAKLNATIERMLVEQAQKAGKVVVPLSKETLLDGTVLQSVASESSGLFKSGYFLQYALLARSGPIAFVTFEGKGDAAAEHAGVKGLFNSVQWNAGEGSAPEQAAFTDRVATSLRTRLGADAVAIAEPLTLKISDLQANLDRVYSFCRSNVQGCDAEVDRYVQAIVDLQKNATAPISREAVRLAVRTTEFADDAARSMAGKGEVIRRPIVDGLVAMPFFDSPRSARLLNAADCKTLGLSPDQAHELGLANLRQALKPMADVARPVKPGAIGTIQGDFYESGRVLLHGDWAPLAKAQQGVVIVALPAKDTLLYGADDSPAGLDALRTLARDVSRRSPGQLSDVLLRWTETGWQLVR
jgi:uncharacterized protein YtpQ (UPF0354 family)